MTPVAQEERQLLAEGLLYLGRCSGEGGGEVVSQNDAHEVPVS
jgi:hypothetical protein